MINPMNNFYSGFDNAHGMAHCGFLDAYFHGADVGIVNLPLEFRDEDVEGDFDGSFCRVLPVYGIVGGSVRMLREDEKGRDIDIKA